MVPQQPDVPVRLLLQRRCHLGVQALSPGHWHRLVGDLREHRVRRPVGHRTIHQLLAHEAGGAQLADRRDGRGLVARADPGDRVRCRAAAE